MRGRLGKEGKTRNREGGRREMGRLCRVAVEKGETGRGRGRGNEGEGGREGQRVITGQSRLIAKGKGEGAQGHKRPLSKGKFQGESLLFAKF